MGLKFIYYSELVKKRLSLPSLAEGYLKDLALETGENTALTVLYQQRLYVPDSVRGEDSALTSNLLPFPALNTCSSGKLFLSRWDDSALRSYFSKPDPAKPTHNTIVTFEDFKAEQKKILENKIAYDDEENEYGLFLYERSPLQSSGTYQCQYRNYCPEITSYDEGYQKYRRKASQRLQKPSVIF